MKKLLLTLCAATALPGVAGAILGMGGGVALNSFY